MDDLKLEATTLHIVKSEDLNHHGTLFAGQMAKWLIEAGLITASSLIGRPEDILCVKVHGLTFKKPINNGDLLEIKSRVAHFGQTSITIFSEVIRGQDGVQVVYHYITFVTVGKNNKPYKHGLTLSEDYIKRNKSIYDEAIKLKGAR